MATPARIPPIQCLQAFEALARLRSVSAAGEELNVTPSAVSHRMRLLETPLGVRLFTRGDFRPGAEGAAYLAQVRVALQALRQTPGQAAMAAPVARVRLAVTPTFSRQIRLPRLAAFRRRYPEVEPVLQVAIPLLDVKAEDADLEVRFGAGPYSGVEQVRILADQVCPVCSPEYEAEAGPFEGRFETADEVQRVRLIRSPLVPWSLWFQAHGINLPEPREGAQFNLETAVGRARVGCDAVRWQGATTLRAHAREEGQRHQRAVARPTRVRSAVTHMVKATVGTNVKLHTVWPAEASGRLRFLGSTMSA